MNALLDLAKGYNSNSNACISLIAQLVKNPPPMQETLVQFLGQEDPSLEKGKATHSSILAWRIPWNPKGLKELDTTESLSFTSLH